MSEEIQVVRNGVVEKMSEELIAQLRKVPILSSLKDEELHCIEGVQEIHLNAGEAVARQGEIAHFFWILLKGELRVHQTQPDGSDVTLGMIEDGNAFGELPLLTNVPNAGAVETTAPSRLLQLNEDQFWNLMTSCPEVRKAILSNMAYRFQKLQSVTLQQEKMASLGTLAAGLMHELNNPELCPARRHPRVRGDLMQMHELSLKFKECDLTPEQKRCMFDLQKQALALKKPLMMNSLDQSDAEEALAGWMESANIENAWKMAPTLVSIGMNAEELERVRKDFDGPMLGDALGWLEALVSSMQLVGTIEESIGRVTDLVHAVKTYAYEGKGQKQAIDINDSIHATLVILGHKFREKEIVLEKNFAPDLPLHLRTELLRPPTRSGPTCSTMRSTHLSSMARSAMSRRGRRDEMASRASRNTSTSASVLRTTAAASLWRARHTSSIPSTRPSLSASAQASGSVSFSASCSNMAGSFGSVLNPAIRNLLCEFQAIGNRRLHRSKFLHNDNIFF